MHRTVDIIVAYCMEDTMLYGGGMRFCIIFHHCHLTISGMSD